MSDIHDEFRAATDVVVVLERVDGTMIQFIERSPLNGANFRRHRTAARLTSTDTAEQVVNVLRDLLGYKVYRSSLGGGACHLYKELD